MNKHSIITYDKQLFLDRKRMDELRLILQECCEKLCYEIECIDNSLIKFDTYDELMEYDNFGKGRINKLRVIGYGDGDTGEKEKIALLLSNESYKAPYMKCTCNFSGENEEIIFKKKILYFCQKATKDHQFATVLWIIPTVLFVVVPLAVIIYYYKLNSFLVFSVLSLSLVTIWMFFVFIWKKLYPPVSFSWGEAIEYYRKIKERRYGLFWCVFVAIVASLMANTLFHLLTKA